VERDGWRFPARGPVDDFLTRVRRRALGRLQLATLHSNADYFMQRFYGPSSGAANLGRFRNAEFDALFRKSRTIADSRRRADVYAKMASMIYAYNRGETRRISSAIRSSRRGWAE